MNGKQDDMAGKQGDLAMTAGRKDRPGGWRRAGRFTFRIMLILGGLFVLLVAGLLVMNAFSMQGLDAFGRFLDRADQVLVYIRLTAIGLLIGFWRPINVWLSRVRGWSYGQLERILAGRWWALATLLFVELILVQRVHEHLIDRVK